LFKRKPPNNMENKMTKFAKRFAADKFLKAVAKHKHSPAADKLNKTKTSRNFPKVKRAWFKPIM
jgi:hypothetical protein